ncbi:hypothetical protein GCM10010182_21200 [Actinomadura cremea]|nr:hypothetical protein GCM10010182_21200 [Actinomadura cremea]
MKGDKDSGPYPLPGQDWGAPPDAPGADAGSPAGGAHRSAPKNWRIYLLFSPFVAAIAIVPAILVGLEMHRDGREGPAATATSEPPPSPEPEPVSTVPPEVKGWKAVTSAKYGYTYDVPRSRRRRCPRSGSHGSPAASGRTETPRTGHIGRQLRISFG